MVIRSEWKPVPDEPTASSSRKVYARSPTVTCGEPVLSNARTPAARINETNRDTQSLALPTPRFARKVSTWNSPKDVKGAYPQNIMVGNGGIRSRKCISKNSLNLQHFSVGRRASRPTNVLVLQSEHEQTDIAFVRRNLLQDLSEWWEDFTEKSGGRKSVSIKEYTREHFS